MVLYFGGTGEHGTNLIAQFHQTTVFQKVTHPEFQKRHPCYLFAPMFPKGTVIRSGQSGLPSNISDLACDAMYAVIRELKSPPVDTNRLYLTGLSYGGVVAFEIPCHFPGRFATGVPVACFQSPLMIPRRQPGNYWLLYNESAYRSGAAKEALAELTRTVRDRGGDFRVATFPDVGHNAWDKAWREDAVWDWMFNKTANGRPVGDEALSPFGPRPATRSTVAPAESLAGAVCTASKPGADDGHGPERAADGLDATCYVSAEPMKQGDWWMVAFAAPVSGRITVYSGTREGVGKISSGLVEVSSDGRFWTRSGGFSSSTGACAFTQRLPIRKLRVLPKMFKPEVLTLREVKIESQ